MADDTAPRPRPTLGQLLAIMAVRLPAAAALRQAFEDTMQTRGKVPSVDVLSVCMGMCAIAAGPRSSLGGLPEDVFIEFARRAYRAEFDVLSQPPPRKDTLH